MSLCVCVWAMLPDSNKMMMMMMIASKSLSSSPDSEQAAGLPVIVTTTRQDVRRRAAMLSPGSASREGGMVAYEINGIESICCSGEVTRASSPVDSEVPTGGFDHVDPRLCQSTTSLSILSRKVSCSSSCSK